MMWFMNGLRTVAPLVGAWIEISSKVPYSESFSSLLSWERGLKFGKFASKKKPATSLLSWERGLKLELQAALQKKQDVAPLVGAWIEIELIIRDCQVMKSLLSWERGLKL